MESTKEIFSKKIAAGLRTYFIDVMETENQDKYMVIMESTKEDDDYIHNRVMVFSENIEEFSRAVNEAIAFMI